MTDIAQITSAIEDFLHFLVSRKQTSPGSPSAHVVTAASGQAYTLTQEEYERYCDTLRQWHSCTRIQEDFNWRHSQTVLYKAIETVLLPEASLRSIKNSNLIKLALANIAKVINITVSLWQVFLPVENVSDNGLPYNFGEFTFRSADGNLKAELTSKSEQILTGSLNTFENRERDLQIVEHFYESEITSKNQDKANERGNIVLAEILVFAETENGARAEAMRRLRLTLDVLNFYADILTRPDLAAFAYLPGEGDPGSRFSPTYKLDDLLDVESGSYQAAMSGPICPMRLDVGNLENAKRKGLDHVSRILSTQSEDRTEIETRLLSSIRWAGRATIKQLASSSVGLDSARDEAFLYFAISLESLVFAENEKKGATGRFSLRPAFLLADTSKYFEDVQSISIAMRELYNIRSIIVHQGTDFVSPNDANNMRNIAKSSTLKVLLGEEFVHMKSNLELEEWFREKEATHQFELEIRDFSSQRLSSFTSILSSVVETARQRKIREFYEVVEARALEEKLKEQKAQGVSP